MPINHAPVWTLDGLTLNGPPDSNNVQWIATSDSDPLSAPAPTTSFTPKYQRHGSYWLPGYVERGTATLTIRAYALDKSWATLRTASLKMLALCQDVTKLYPFVFQSEVGNLVQNVVREGDILLKHVNAQNPAFEASIQLASPDPRRYEETWQTLVTGVPQGSNTGLDFATNGGLDFDGGSGAGLDFGTAIGGTLAIDNTRGTAPTAPTLTLTGPLTTPIISAAGGSLKYNGTLAAGEFVVINPEDPSALLGGASSRNFLLNPADWSAFIVQPGQTLTVGLSHSGASSDAGTLTVQFRPAYW